jgi:hypothetical protein
VTGAYILLIYRDSATWESMTDEQRREIARGHDRFQSTVSEMVFTEALADPSQTIVVRVRGDASKATPGPYQETRHFLCGYYLVDCAGERAVELAALVPEARYTAVEVRPLTVQLGTEFSPAPRRSP